MAKIQGECRVQSINVSLDPPVEWGSILSVVDQVKGDTLLDLLYHNFMEWLSEHNRSNDPKCLHIEDETCGFDYESFSLCIVCGDDMKAFESTKSLLVDQYHRAYMRIPYRFRKRAKNTLTR
jgi:hypothetical protein